MYFCIKNTFDNLSLIKELCGLEVIVNSLTEHAKIDGKGCAAFFCGYINKE